MISNRNPESMTLDERRREVAAILARGLSLGCGHASSGAIVAEAVCGGETGFRRLAPVPRLSVTLSSATPEAVPLQCQTGLAVPRMWRSCDSFWHCKRYMTRVAGRHCTHS
jgi:hypothetical protein